MPLVTSDEEVAGPENGSNTIEGQGGAGFPARRFITRTAVAAAVDRKDCETHYRGEGFLFLTKSNKTQKELIYLFIF